MANTESVWENNSDQESKQDRIERDLCPAKKAASYGQYFSTRDVATNDTKAVHSTKTKRLQKPIQNPTTTQRRCGIQNSTLPEDMKNYNHEHGNDTK